MTKFPSLNIVVKNKNLLAALLLILILIIFFRDVVFGGRTFLMETAAPGTMPQGGPYKYEGVTPGFVVNDAGAIAWQIEPFNRFISKSIKSGDFPLWNPYAGLAGNPLFADGQTAPLEPIQLLFFFFPARWWPLSIDLQLLIRFFIAGFACYLFARRQRIDFFGSIAAAVLFMLSSYFVTFGNHAQIKTESLLPLVLYGYDRLVDPKDRIGFWWCALFIGWAIIAAMPESTFFVLFLGSLWYFYKSILQIRTQGHLLQDTRSLLFRYLGSTILGFLISAVYLLPFLEFVAIAKSVHSPGTGGIAFPVWALLNLIFQVPNFSYLQLGFFASFSLLFLLLHLKDWPAEYRQSIIFFSSYAVILISILFGFPLTNWIRTLPIFNQLVLEKYSIPSIAFCLSILTGILIDRAKTVRLFYWKLSLALLVMFLLFFYLPIRENPAKSLDVYFADQNAMYAALDLIIGISVALVLVSFVYRHRKISAPALQVCLLILVILEPFFWSRKIQRPDRVDPFQVPPFVEYLRDDKQPFRIFGMDNILYPNISTAYRVADIRWLNALVPQSAFDFSSQFIESREVNTIRLTGTVLPISDEMFDLLNVKYVLVKRHSSVEGLETCSSTTDAQPYFGKDTIHQLILEQNVDKKSQLSEATLNINGATRMTIWSHPPQQFSVKLDIPQSSPTLDFSIGLSPDVFVPRYGDGVTYKITLLDGSHTVDLYSRYIDPKNNPCDRKWFDESIDLTNWSGKEVTLNFSTDAGPVGNSAWDWAVWGSISIAAQTDLAAPVQSRLQYEQIYRDRDVLIYRNKDVFPRAFVVYNIVNVGSPGDSFAQLTNSNIDLKHTAIVENLPVELANSISKNDKAMQAEAGSARLINSDEMEVRVRTRAPGLLVVTDQYYPGWKAYIDGKQVPIHAVDGIFRGVFLETGDHIIQFKYRPPWFFIGGMISSLSLLVTIIYIISRSKKQSERPDLS